LISGSSYIASRCSDPGEPIARNGAIVFPIASAPTNICGVMPAGRVLRGLRERERPGRELLDIPDAGGQALIF
jgi:hypothetical protein